MIDKIMKTSYLMGARPGYLPSGDGAAPNAGPTDTFTASSGEKPDFLAWHPRLTGAAIGIGLTGLPILAMAKANPFYCLPALAVAGLVGGVIGWMESRK